MSFEDRFQDASVLVTGHSGFSGGWLSSWLLAIGARVHGIALAPEPHERLFEALDLEARMASSVFADINEPQAVRAAMEAASPRVVFHLAAQPIVSRGYADPHGTFLTNVMGTLNVLEAARTVPGVEAVVCVTTDKVYRNMEWVHGYRESDPLGGKDPYSASKVGSEAVIAAYRETLAARGNGVRIAAARGGNIIGGGDFAPDRIVPDFVRAARDGRALELRNPSATRPWQHVLALVHGYLVLAAALLADAALLEDAAHAGAWNFGPTRDANRPVSDLVEGLARFWPHEAPPLEYGTGTFAEAHLLHLSSDKAQALLGWRPPLGFHDTLELTAEWYAAFLRDEAQARPATDGQVARYRALLAET